MTQGQSKPELVGDSEWFYDFELDEFETKGSNPNQRVRHTGRRDYIFDPLLALFGGSLRGKRVLDLGCNAGFFSLAAIDAGCEKVIGVESDPRYHNQAQLVFQTKKVDPVVFELRKADVFEFLASQSEHFDIVLCLGLAHHLDALRYFDFFQLVSAINTDVLVIDTVLASFRYRSQLEIHRKPSAHRQNPGANIVLHPTRLGLLQLLDLFGYKGAVLKPTFEHTAVFSDYNGGARRAFVGAKITDLGSLAPFLDASTDPNLMNIPAKLLIETLYRKLSMKIRLSRR